MNSKCWLNVLYYQFQQTLLPRKKLGCRNFPLTAILVFDVDANEIGFAPFVVKNCVLEVIINSFDWKKQEFKTFHPQNKSFITPLVTVKSFRTVLILGLITVWRPQNWNDCKKSVWFAQLLSSWMKFNMNAEIYSIEQQENCVSTPESNVSVLTELEEGNNYFIFISFVHSPQMSNDLIGQGSSRRMFSKVHHPIKNGGEFLPSLWNNFLDRSMSV